MQNMIIKPADKGSAVVVLSTDDYSVYIRETDWQLNNLLYYKKLNVDPTSHYKSEIKNLVDSMLNRGLVDKKIQEFLVPFQPPAARFYHLQQSINLETREDSLWLLTVPQRRASPALWIFISNQVWLISHLISGTSLILLTNFRCYMYLHSTTLF